MPTTTMTAVYDIVIRNGRVIDGTGAPERVADIAIDGSTIAAVGTVTERGRREIDATGLVVTPGWVDTHTHYDGQVTWDPELTPSGWHGVTTVVMGNCGVGFAPVTPGDEEYLVQVMEGVEDIPGAALAEGIEWNWSSFEEYLDDLDTRSWVCDVGTQVPHVALRTHVMGKRGADHEPARADDLARMRALTARGLQAGALGVSTSRTPLHKTIEGELVPGTFAEEIELFALAEGIADAGHGVFQCALHHPEVPPQFEWLRKVAEISGQPVTFNFNQVDSAPEVWRDVVRLLDEAAADGVPVTAQVAGRAVGILMSWEGTVHPFVDHPRWPELAALAPAERVARLADPQVREDLLTRPVEPSSSFAEFLATGFHKMFPFTGETDYEPAAEASLASRAERAGADPLELAYDQLMGSDGNGLIYFPLMNYTEGNLDLLHLMHRHPGTIMGLADAGAHCGAICDGGMPTFMITHWTRDRARDQFELEWMVSRQTRETAHHFGLDDRGVLAPGYRADVNVIDYERLTVQPARIAHDLPAGARRYVQEATGYRYTICAGVVVRENDRFTGDHPGRLIRGPQSAPAAESV